jgi:hypothetical protein
MRAALAAALALLLTTAVVVPHVHAAWSGDECPACVVRGGEPATPAAPDLAPLPPLAGEPLPAPRSVAFDGAPLGAIPGQSPPRA